MRRILLSAVLVGVCAMCASAATLHVPSEYSTIQSGVNAALDGDTVLLVAGTYSGDGNLDVTISNKSLCLRGAGPGETIIDCNYGPEGTTVGLTISGNADQVVTVEWLSIANSWQPGASGAPGLISTDVHLVLRNCEFDQCGSGMYMGSDGAIAVTGGTFTMQAGTVIDNLGGIAGGIRLTGVGQAVISGCDFENNWSGGFGGGGAILAESSNVSIENCFFVENIGFPSVFPIAEAKGGAIVFHASQATVTNCAFYDNHAWQAGGAIASFSSEVDLDTCTFCRNYLGGSRDEILGGSALYIDGGNLNINSCSFSQSATGYAVKILAPAEVGVEHSVFAFTKGGGAFDGLATLICTDIYGNELGDWVGDIADQYGIDGNLSADPLFCDTATGDLKLQDESPCAPENNDCSLRLGSRRVGCDVVCGDANGDGVANVTDAVSLIQWIFGEGHPAPYDNADADCSGTINITDAVYLILYIFQNGPEPCAECP